MYFRYLLSFLLFFTALSVFAQTGRIRGFVNDAGGQGALPFVVVEVVGTQFGAMTDQKGFYQINDVPVGNYQVRVNYAGYEEVTKSIEVKEGGIVNVSFQLEEKSEVLGDVVVNAQAIQRKTKVLTGVQNLSPKSITKFSVGGEPDLVRALQVLPGVVTTGDQGGQLYIRGGAPIQNLTLLDGMILYQPFHSIGFFSVFDTDILQSADIYTAGFKAQYGSRTSSVMDIRTRPGNRSRFSGKLSASTFTARALLEGPIGKVQENGFSNSSFLVSAKYSYLDQISPTVYPYAETAFGDGELPFQFRDLYAKYSYTATGGSNLNLYGFSFTDAVDFTPSQGINWENTGLGGDFTIVPPNSATLISGFFAYSNYEINSTEIPNQPRNSSIGGFNAGIDFTYFVRKIDEVKYGIQIIGYQTSYNLTNPLGLKVSNSENTNEIAGFGQYKFQANRWLIEPGIRLHYFGSLGELSLEPRLGMKYSLTENIRLKGSGGRYSQNLLAATSDRDVVNLFYGFLTGTNDLPEEFRGEEVNSSKQTAWHAVLGFEFDFLENWTFDAEAYIKDFTQLTNLNRNKIYASNTKGVPDYQKSTFIVEDGLARGLDFLLKYNDSKKSLWLAYSLGEVTRRDEIQEYNPVFDRRHNLNIVGSYYWGKKNEWEVSVRWNFGSGFPFTPTQGYYPLQSFQDENGLPDLTYPYTTANGDPSILYGDLNSNRLPSYHRLDASINKRWDIKKYQEFNLTLAVTNIYNRDNIFYVDRETAQRVNQLPILPTLIASYKF